MFQNDVLDIAIGLVFVWFVLSLIISVVNDGFALLFRVRAKNLWLGIDRLLNPKTGKYARHFWDAVLFLPLSRKGLDIRPIAGAGSSDADISADLTAKAKELTTKVESAGTAQDRKSRQQRLQRIYDVLAPSITDVAIANRKSKLTKISGTVFAEAVASVAEKVHKADLITAATALGWSQDKLTRIAQALVEFDRDDILSLEQTKNALGTLPPGPQSPAVDPGDVPHLYDTAAQYFTPQDVINLFEGNEELVQALKKAAALSGADKQIAAIKTTVETWFDREMEQASALYRRQNRKVLALLALPVVLIFQANTLGIISDLRSDSALREAVVNQAISLGETSSLKEAIAISCPTAAASTTPADPLIAATERLQCAGNIIRGASTFALLPDRERFDALDSGDAWLLDAWEYEIRDWGWIGRTITVLALMFGAQFWFDVLRRLIGVRKTLGSGGSSAG